MISTCKQVGYLLHTEDPLIYVFEAFLSDVRKVLVIASALVFLDLFELTSLIKSNLVDSHLGVFHLDSLINNMCSKVFLQELGDLLCVWVDLLLLGLSQILQLIERCRLQPKLLH